MGISRRDLFQGLFSKDTARALGKNLPLKELARVFFNFSRNPAGSIEEAGLALARRSGMSLLPKWLTDIQRDLEDALTLTPTSPSRSESDDPQPSTPESRTP